MSDVLSVDAEFEQIKAGFQKLLGQYADLMYRKHGFGFSMVSNATLHGVSGVDGYLATMRISDPIIISTSHMPNPPTERFADYGPACYLSLGAALPCKRGKDCETVSELEAVPPLPEVSIAEYSAMTPSERERYFETGIK